ncbi:membrane protein insertase YidC [Companilactobacillus sp. DQM5]|uniref:membrane protein insertase YidC n=1 Tax=Companilactobacillus sp. DQM5 TaxID=3463359 RepID=UPI00405978DA
MKNKNLKRIFSLTVLFLLIAITTAACARTTGSNGVIKPPTSGPYAFIFKYIGSPFQHLIEGTAKTIGGNNGFALGIIVISFVVRLVLLPLGLNQSYKATMQQEKMKAIQPQLKLIQEKQKEAKNPDAQAKISQLMMSVYRENNMSLVGGVGCLPLLIQMPVLIGIYQAVQYSKEIGSATFFGLPLGKSSIVIAIIATLFYVAQSYLSVQVMPEEQRKQSQTIMYMNPIITFFISMVSSAALGLYFLVGGVIILIQQIITNYVVQPRVRKTIDEDLKKNPVKEVVTEESLNEIIKNSESSSDTSNSTNKTSDKDNKNTSKASQHARNKNKNIQQNKKD